MADKTREVAAFIDRIEKKLAVIILSDDDKVQFDLPLKYLPAGVAEGDHLRIRFERAPESKQEAQKRVEQLKRELTKDQDQDQQRFKL